MLVFRREFVDAYVPTSRVAAQRAEAAGEGDAKEDVEEEDEELKDVEEAFTAGLVHDVGMLVMMFLPGLTLIIAGSLSMAFMGFAGLL